jgi:hypothetical protein
MEEEVPVEADVPTIDVSDIVTEDGEATLEIGGEDAVVAEPVEITGEATVVEETAE